MSSKPLSTPLTIEGTVVTGFGRGGKLLGFPTANLDSESVMKVPHIENMNGVYAGWIQVLIKDESPSKIFKTVLSIGDNPHFKGEKKTVEPHILNTFEKDFYGANVKLLVTHFIRPMASFDGLDALIEAINNDCTIGKKVLDEDAIDTSFFDSK